MTTCVILNVDCGYLQTLSIAIGSALQLVSVIILVVSVYYVVRQVREMRLATYASAYKAVFEILQSEDIRTARRYVFTQLRQKAFKKWNQKDVAQAEKVCQAYDAVGQMVRNGMLPVKYIVDNWRSGLVNSWPILSPMVNLYRVERNSPEEWDDYEYIAKEAMLYEKKMKTT